MDATSLWTNIVDYIIDPVMLLLFSAGLLVFFWGLVQFLMKAESSEGRSTGVRHMLWGVVGMLIMVSAGAIIGLITNTFDLDVEGAGTSKSTNTKEVNVLR